MSCLSESTSPRVVQFLERQIEAVENVGDGVEAHGIDAFFNAARLKT